MKSTKIDAVYTYVDGSDPKFIKRYNKWAEKQGLELKSNNFDTRYTNCNEITYSLLSLFRFAPFINQVYIITYDQKPNFEPFIKTYFPERLKDIHIVDHKEIFSGFEDLVYPTFNSDSIEAFMWNIPDLEENFVYFNDDVLLLRDIKAKEWLRADNKLLVLGRFRLGKWLKYMKNGALIKQNKPIDFNYTYRQYIGARLLDYKWFFPYLTHTPHPFKKSVMKEVFKHFEKKITKNASYKFRYANTFSMNTFYSSALLKAGKGVLKYEKEFYINFSNPDKKYLTNKMNRLERNKTKNYLCIQSLSLADDEFQSRLINFLNERLMLNRNLG